MSVVRAVGKGVAWTTSSVMLGKVLILANIFLIFRTLSVYEYGLTELTMSAYLVASIVFLPGIVSTITTDMAVERARGNIPRLKALFWGYLRVASVFGFIAWIIFFFGSSIVAHYTGNDLIDSYIKIVSFLFFLAPLRIMTTTLATITRRFADLALIPLIEEVAKFGSLLFFFNVLELHASGLLFSVLVAQVVTISLFGMRTRSAYRELGPEKPGTIAHPIALISGHRKWSVASSALSSLSQNLYVWLVKVFLGTEAVGLYSAATGIVSNLAGLLPMSTVLNTLAPQYVDRPKDLVRLIRSSIKLQLLISLALVVSGILFGPLFAYFFPNYKAALPLFYLLLIGLVPNAVMITLSPIFAIYKEQQSMLYSAIFKFVLTVTVAPIAFLTLGLYGIALENAIRYVACLIERVFRVRRFWPEFTWHIGDIFTVDPLELNLARILLQRVKKAIPFI